MPQNNLLSQIKAALHIDIEQVIDHAIMDQLMKWRSKNDYSLIAKEIERMSSPNSHPIENYVNWSTFSLTGTHADYIDYYPHRKEALKEIIDNFRYDIVEGLSKEKLHSLLGSLLRFQKRNYELFDFNQQTFCENIAECLYSNRYDALTAYVQVNSRRLFSQIKIELETPEFNTFKFEFIDTQNELRRSFEENDLTTLYQYQAHIILTIDLLMTSMLKQMQDSYFADYNVFDARNEVSFNPVAIDHLAISKTILSFHKLFVPENKLEKIIYSSKTPGREASTEDQLPLYIKGLISKGEFLSRDYQQKSDIVHFTSKYSELQSFIQSNCLELEGIILTRIEGTKNSNRLSSLHGHLEALKKINSEISLLMDSKQFTESCLVCLTQDISSSLIEKIDADSNVYKLYSTKGALEKRIILDSVQTDLLKKNEMSLTRKFESICYELDISSSSSNEFLTFQDHLERLKPFKQRLETAIKEYGEDLTNSSLDTEIRKDIFRTKQSLLKKLKKFDEEIVAMTIKSYQFYKDKILELAYQRVDIFRELFPTNIPKQCLSYRQLTKKLELDLPVVRNNMLVYMALFCVDSDPDSGKASKRIFVPVHIGKDQKSRLNIPILEADENQWNDLSEEVLIPLAEYKLKYGRTAAEVLGELKDEDAKFMSIIGERSVNYHRKTTLGMNRPGDDPRGFSEIAFHSERVFTSTLKEHETVEILVQNLEKSVAEYIETGVMKASTLLNRKHKVYSITILAYSTNSVCPHCTRALITQLNDVDPHNSFLGQLYDRLSQSYLLTTSSKQLENDVAIKRSTIIISGKEYSSDSQGNLRYKFPSMDSISRLPISREGILDIKITPRDSFVEMVRSVDPMPRRIQVKGDSCSSGSNLEQDERDSTASIASSLNYILPRQISYKGRGI